MTEFEKQILEKLDRLIEIGMWTEDYKEVKARVEADYRKFVLEKERKE